MFIICNSFKSHYGVCRKYFTQMMNHHSINSSLLRSYPQHKLLITVRLNHDELTPAEIPRENAYYHSFLAKNKKYTQTVAFLDYTPENDLPSDINSILNEKFDEKHGITLISYLYAALKHSHHSNAIYDDARFRKLCDTLSSKVSTLHEDHVLNVLKVMTLWSNAKKDGLFYDMCRTIDKVLLPNYKIWGFDRCILIMDHFYRLQVLRFSETVWNCMKRLWRDPNRLTSTQAVHAMFLVNAHRNWHPAVHMYNVECYLQHAAYELCAEECAIMALAFFKTNHRIKNLDLLNVLHRKLALRISNLDSIPLVGFLKVFRSCSHYRLKDQMRNLLNLLNGIVDKHDYICCTHMALLGTSMLVWNSKLYQNIARRFVDEISSIRIKDIERTILAFQTFNYESRTEPDVYTVALNELAKRKNEVFDHARSFYSAVWFLSLKGYYNFDLVNFLLSEDVIKKSFKHKDLSKFNCHTSLLTISDGVKIDFPEYSGNFLNESLRKDLCLSQSWKIPVELSRKPLPLYDQVLIQAKSVFQGMFGGADFVHYTYVLPHLSRPDLIFRLNGDTPMKLPREILSSTYVDSGIPSETEDWYVVTYLGRNTVIFETDQPIGNTLTKFRHYKKIGYKVLCIKEQEWRNKSQDEHREYLRQLLNDSRLGNQPEVQQPIRVEPR